MEFVVIDTLESNSTYYGIYIVLTLQWHLIQIHPASEDFFKLDLVIKFVHWLFILLAKLAEWFMPSIWGNTALLLSFCVAQYYFLQYWASINSYI